jgi:hypothetical protein
MYEIADYDERYRPYDKSGGELKNADWVKLPAKPKGDGLQSLLEYPRGLEIFAIWCLLLEKTTSETKPENRGKLLNHKDQPATISEIAKSISLPTRVKLVENAISALVEIGWVKSEQTSGEAEQCSSKSSVVKSRVEKGKSSKFRFLQFVFLTKDEHQKLIERFGQKATDKLIDNLDFYIENNKKGRDPYTNHYRTLCKWAAKDNIPEIKKEADDKQALENKHREMREQYGAFIREADEKKLITVYKEQINLRWLIRELRPEIMGKL